MTEFQIYETATSFRKYIVEAKNEVEAKSLHLEGKSKMYRNDYGDCEIEVVKN